MAGCLATCTYHPVASCSSIARQPCQRLLAPAPVHHARPFATQQRRHALLRPAQQPVRAEGDDAPQSTATEVQRIDRYVVAQSTTACFKTCDKDAVMCHCLKALVCFLLQDEELPPWLRKEKLQKMADAEGGLPFGLYLLASGLVAIAAVHHVLERRACPTI